MKILVCVKQASEVAEFVEFLATGTDVDPAFLTYELNEADAYAVEEALCLRENHGDCEVVVVTAGGERAEEALRRCIAMGVDRAVRVSLEPEDAFDPVLVGRRLAAAARVVEPDLILCGVQSSDSVQQSTGPALASALSWPSVSVVTKLDRGDDGLVLRREFEGGLSEVVEVEGPAVITVQMGLNQPRYGTFKDKIKAQKATIEVVDEASPPARVAVRRMYQPTGGDSRLVSVEPSKPDEVAARIMQIVREAQR